jgi:quercetin dioxygenase-like cupin family protein
MRIGRSRYDSSRDSRNSEGLMLVVNHRDRPIIHSSSGRPSLSMVVNHEVGARSMSIWTTFHEPGEVVPLHTHEYEEIITVIAGEAIVTVEGESAPVHADMSVIIPAHTPHGYRNAGDGVLRMIASFPVPDAVLGKRFSS